jgi:hypothetical protein
MWWRWGAVVSLTTAVVVLALLQCGGWAGTINADGISYLDLAAMYAHGHLGAIANGYWSPLYPLLLGAALRVASWLPGGGPGELRVVFAVNVVIFAGAAVALVRLGRSLARTADATGASGASSAPAMTAARAFRALAVFALGIWALIRLIGATTVTPDALLAIWTFLAAADLCDAATGAPSVVRDRRFAVVLAVGYWTKAVFLPVGVACIVAYFFATQRASRRVALRNVVLPFLLIIAPLVAVQSWSQGRPSFGETGRLNYRWYVARMPHAPLTVESIETTARRHVPAAVVVDALPGTTLFAGEAEGSFPYWFDPSRFEPRGGVPVSLAAQMLTLTNNARWFRVAMGAFTLWAVIALCAALLRARARPRRLWALVPAVVMLLLYAMTHTEGRMGAASIVIVLLVIVYAADAVPANRRKILAVIECAALGVLAILALGRTAKRVPDYGARSAMTATDSLASALRLAGITSGARVAVVGSPFGHYWAHQTGARVVASLPLPDSLRPVDDAALERTTAELAARGSPVSAVLWPTAARIQSVRGRPLAGGMWIYVVPERNAR